MQATAHERGACGSEREAQGQGCAGCGSRMNTYTVIDSVSDRGPLSSSYHN